MKLTNIHSLSFPTITESFGDMESVFQPNFTSYTNQFQPQAFTWPSCDIFADFCLWDLAPSTFEQPMVDSRRVHQKDTRSIHTYDFSKNIAKLMDLLMPKLGTGRPFVSCKRKAQAWKAKNVSKRRSRFTGVTRNSINYQTLIVIKGKKTYVASYPSELYAAVTFDFYSLILHGARATTNFTYTADDVKQMIDSFINNDNVFDPSGFVPTNPL